MNNILLIENNWFHDEVFIPLVEILNDENNLFLILNKKSIKKGIWELYSKKYNTLNITYVNKIYNNYISSLDNYRRAVYTLIHILKNKIDTIIFNTLDLSNEDILLLIKAIKRLKPDIKLIGIVHNAETAQKYCKTVDKILVLNKYIADNMNSNIRYFYPILYKYKNNIVSTKDEKFSIVVPGNIEYSRRDYDFLLELVDKQKDFFSDNKIKFIILGNYRNNKDGELFYQCVKQNGYLNFFEFYDYLIPYQKYMRTIIQSQLIMPLIHPNLKSFSNYFSHKISASFNMSFSTNIPLLMHKEFQNIKYFNKFSYFYDLNPTKFREVIEEILKDKQHLLNTSLKIKNEISFSKENQKKLLYEML